MLLRALRGATVVAVMTVALLGPVRPAGAQADAPGAVSGASAVHYCVPHVVALGGIEQLHHIRVGPACRAVRKLVAWLERPGHRLVRCPGPTAYGAGTLVRHRFDGYRLSVSPVYGLLVMSRGGRSFVVVGFSGWPVGCD